MTAESTDVLISYGPAFPWAAFAGGAVLLVLAFRFRVLPGRVGFAKVRAFALVLALAGLGLLLWAVSDYYFYGGTRLPFGGVLPALAMNWAGTVTLLLNNYFDGGRA